MEPISGTHSHGQVSWNVNRLLESQSNQENRTEPLRIEFSSLIPLYCRYFRCAFLHSIYSAGYRPSFDSGHASPIASSNRLKITEDPHALRRSGFLLSRSMPWASLFVRQPKAAYRQQVNSGANSPATWLANTRTGNAQSKRSKLTEDQGYGQIHLDTGITAVAGSHGPALETPDQSTGPNQCADGEAKVAGGAQQGAEWSESGPLNLVLRYVLFSRRDGS